MSELITDNSEDRRFRKCKCAECGIIAQCTPAFDFYVRGMKSSEAPPATPIVCEACILKPFNRVIDETGVNN